MKTKKHYFIQLVTFGYFALIAINVGASEPFISNTEKQPNAIEFGLNASTNTIVYGQINTELKQPDISPFFNFISSSGFEINTTFYRVGNTDSTESKGTNEFDVLIGYNKTFFNQKLTLYPSFSHFFYGQGSESMKSVIKNQLSLNISYDFTWLLTGITGSYLKGDYTDYNIIGQLLIPINFENIFSKNDALTIGLGSDVFYGKLPLTILNKLKNLQNQIDNARKKHPLYDPTLLRMTSPSIFPVINANHKRNKKKLEAINQEVYGNTNLDYNETISDYLSKAEKQLENENSTIGLTSIDFTLPVIYTKGNFSFSLSANATKPMHPKADLAYYFNTGIIYNFSW